MHETRPEAMHIHDELSPILDNIEVLIDLCIDQQEGGTAERKRRRVVLYDVLESEAKRLRDRLDRLCSVARDEVQP